jgi:hypothetical protein
MTNTRTHSPIEFEDALLRCREVAEVEYRVADEALGHTEIAAERLHDRIGNMLQELSARPNGDGMPAVIRKMTEQLSHQIEHLIIRTRKKLTAKRPVHRMPTGPSSAASGKP